MSRATMSVVKGVDAAGYEQGLRAIRKALLADSRLCYKVGMRTQGQVARHYAKCIGYVLGGMTIEAAFELENVK